MKDVFINSIIILQRLNLNMFNCINECNYKSFTYNLVNDLTNPRGVFSNIVGKLRWKLN